MNQPRIGLIACANGLGHVRRMLALWNELRKYPVQPIMIAPQKAVNHLCEIYGLDLPETFDCHLHVRTASAELVSDGFEISSLPDLSDFSEIISDNIIEILNIYPRTWLSGSFFWHRALTGYPKKWALQAEALLAKHQPRMIATKLLAPSYLAENTRLHAVGLYGFGRRTQHMARTDLLISCGKGGNVLQETGALLDQIIEEIPDRKQVIWIEPQLYRATMPNWVRPATFLPDMFDRLAAAVIRPGVGTLTDLLISGVKPFMFYEAENMEMRENAAKISQPGLGVDCGSASRAWQEANKYFQNQEAQATFRKNLTTLDLDGAAQAAQLIVHSAKT